MRGFFYQFFHSLRRFFLEPLHNLLLRDGYLRQKAMNSLRNDFLRELRKNPQHRKEAVGSVHPKVLIESLETVGIAGFLQRPGFSYVPDYYGRSWNKRTNIRDLSVFGKVATDCIQKGRTLLYYDRLYVLYQGVKNILREHNLENPVRVAEVGVYKGGTSDFLASLMIALGVPLFELHCFDTFEGHAPQDILDGDQYISSGKNKSHRCGHFTDTSLEGVREFLQEWPQIEFHKGRFQNTCNQIEGKKFHLVHLDMDLYAPTLFALEFFHSRLLPGGVIVVDDYEVDSCPGVKDAVREFLERNPNYWALHPMTEQCVLVPQQLESDRFPLGLRREISNRFSTS